MSDLVSKLVTYLFVVVIMSFILNIVRLVYADIHEMNGRGGRGKAKGGAYLKLLNLRRDLYFDVQESYLLAPNQTVGRSESNRIAIRDPFLSKRNTRIYSKKGRFYVEDLGGKNGTLLNGECLGEGVYALENGDRLQLGQVLFLFISGGPGELPGMGAAGMSEYADGEEDGDAGYAGGDGYAEEADAGYADGDGYTGGAGGYDEYEEDGR